MIPKILVRTVPQKTSQAIDDWWEWAKLLHPEWDHVSYQDPIDPKLFPRTSHLWEGLPGAQKAGLIRLEAILKHGGVYIDSDVEVYRPFDPLLSLDGFAGWEDWRVVPDAVFGAKPGHPAIADCLDAATLLVELGRDPWDSGPGVFTDILPQRDDFILFGPQTFYPYHYNEKRKPAAKTNYAAWPWCYAAHHWHGSWVTKK